MLYYKGYTIYQDYIQNGYKYIIKKQKTTNKFDGNGIINYNIRYELVYYDDNMSSY